jgi:hypothetical protein
MPVFFNISGIVLVISELESICTSLVTLSLTSLQESKATSPSSKFLKETEKALITQ